VASLSRKLPIEWDVNYPIYNVTSTGASGASCTNTASPCAYANTTSTANNRRPYNSSAYAATATTTSANPEFSSIAQIQSSEGANYNGLQVTVQERLTHGFSMQGFWVWSKSLQSQNLDSPGNAGNSTTTTPEDPNNKYLDRQRSDFDQRHVVAMSGVWKPYYGFHNGVARQVVNGWTITAIVRLQSGQPFNITTGADNNADGVANDRPNLAPGVTRARVKDNGHSRAAMMQQWVDYSQFCVANGTLNGIPACPQNGTGPANSDGTVRQNTLDAPGRRSIDASVFREFHITERVTFQLRGESTNVFNLTNLPAPTGSLSSGIPPTPGNPAATGSFGRINGSILGGSFGNRIIQVGGRILF
jgi:hypothetical protein